MLALGLVGAGLVAGFLLGLLARRSWQATMLVESLGVAAWAALAIYAGLIYECPAGRECNPDLAWFYGLFALAGWLVGAAIPSVVTYLKRGSGSGQSVA